jgi:hypothetical protein
MRDAKKRGWNANAKKRKDEMKRVTAILEDDHNGSVWVDVDAPAIAKDHDKKCSVM